VHPLHPVHLMQLHISRPRRQARLAPSAPEIMNPSREIRLITALARPAPTSAMIDAARCLAVEGLDWGRLHKLCVRNHIVPLMTAAIDRHLLDLAPAEFRAAMKADAVRARMIAMTLMATQIGLCERLLRPSGARFAVLKGYALSARHYGDPLLRQSNDIDLLVDAAGIPAFVKKLEEEGWRIGGPFWRGQPIELFARFVSVVELSSPDGRRLEVHRSIDGTGIVFDSRQLLARSRALAVCGRDVPALAPIDEALVVLFHHSRHRWCSYHWVADLVAMASEVAVSEPELLAAATSNRSLYPTVVAALRLRREIDFIAEGGDPGTLAESSPFLSPCLDSVDRENALDSMPSDRPAPETEPDFPEAWQRTTYFRVLYQLIRVKPTVNDLNAMRAPTSMPWIYWLVRPFRLLATRLRWLGRIAKGVPL
jgi:hypothetical protein